VRPCESASINEIDLLALRDALQRMGIHSPRDGVESLLSDTAQLSPFVPTLCVREPLTRTLRPRNFAILLFGRNVQRFVPGAHTVFSSYLGTDRSDSHAERRELAGNLIDQAHYLASLLDQQTYTVVDKTDRVRPNALKYPTRALHEAMVNALAHRDYALFDPTRITTFADRIEVLSPGPLPSGVDPEAFRTGRASPKWRNQALAWFFCRLQLAQAEGEGIRTIFRSMKQEGCPPPAFEIDEGPVICTLSAHPRHVQMLVAQRRNRYRTQLLGVITSSGNDGAAFEELSRAAPEAGRDELRVLLRELRREGCIHMRGATRAARWFAGRIRLPE
jgi:ATP-dependent DNA helicase RecG